jgi:hypothetical protein
MAMQTTRASHLERQQFETYPLLDALIERRSRRFGKGFRMPGGPLAYSSQEQPEPLSLDEEAALAFAACGVTGNALADVPYQTGDVPNASGGNMWEHFVGRTVPSPDAAHTVIVFITNDEGTWMLRRPQDFPRGEIAGLAESARQRELRDLYLRSRVRIADGRVDVTREFPSMLPLNKWVANQPGSTYFVPIAECATFFINVLLTAFDDEWAAFPLDERNGFRPAGVGRFARSKGGHLHDDPNDQRIFTVGAIESIIYELVAVETGAIIQNLGLMTQALGLGGFPHSAGHPYAWMQALGFRMVDVPTSTFAALGTIPTLMLRLMGKDAPLPTPVGLERDGEALIRPFTPPYYRDMEEAVLALVDYKFAPGSGTLRDGGQSTAWKNGARVQAGIPRPSDRAIEATIAFCDYLYQRYGRFPINSGPFRNAMAFQAHHLDLSFYDEFYRAEAISDQQRAHANHHRPVQELPE